MSSSSLTDKIAIESYFNTQWASATPIRFESAPFIQPGTQNTTRRPWVSLYIREMMGWQASLGNDSPLRRYSGLIINQVFTDLNIGTATGMNLAMNIADIWRDASFTTGTTGRITCSGFLDGARNTEPKIEIIGDDGHNWFQINVTTRYLRQDYI